MRPLHRLALASLLRPAIRPAPVPAGSVEPVEPVDRVGPVHPVQPVLSAAPAAPAVPVHLVVPLHPVVPAAVRKASATMAARMVSADTVRACPGRTCLSLTFRCVVCN